MSGYIHDKEQLINYVAVEILSVLDNEDPPEKDIECVENVINQYLGARLMDGSASSSLRLLQKIG